MSLAAHDALPALQWSDWSARYRFFTGKGGVGKTTTASAVAIALADTGKRTRVISTDPASNLDDLFGIDASPEPTPVPGVKGLFVSNLDPQAAALALRSVPAEYRGVLPQSAVRNMEEQLSGACAVEIAAFKHTERAQQLSAGGTWLVAWKPEPPIGAVALRQLAADAARSEPALGA